jgi:hypothetical protein
MVEERQQEKEVLYCHVLEVVGGGSEVDLASGSPSSTNPESDSKDSGESYITVTLSSDSSESGGGATCQPGVASPQLGNIPEAPVVEEGELLQALGQAQEEEEAGG